MTELQFLVYWDRLCKFKFEKMQPAMGLIIDTFKPTSNCPFPLPSHIIEAYHQAQPVYEEFKSLPDDPMGCEKWDDTEAKKELDKYLDEIGIVI
jgi:hypothetical protein